MPLTVARVVFAALASLPLATALLATPDSPCAKYCGNVQTSTAVDEMACDHGGVTQGAEGVVWEQCISCLLGSTFVNGDKSDLQALLYNLRFNMGYCLFAGETNPCVTRTACEPYKGAVSYKNISTTDPPLEYCKLWDTGMYGSCSPCLVTLDGPVDGLFQNNYLTILEAACEQNTTAGTRVSVDGDPFGSYNISIVPPEQLSLPTPDYGPISLGARVGIAFGGLALIIALAGIFIVCNGKRKRRAFLRELEKRHSGQGWPHPKTRYGGGGDGSGSGPDMFETPVSQKPLRGGWGDNGNNDSPVSAHPDNAQSFPRYFSPYSSNYTSPVTGPGSSQHQWPGIGMPAPQQLDEMLQAQQEAQDQAQAQAEYENQQQQQYQQQYEQQRYQQQQQQYEQQQYQQQQQQQYHHPQPSSQSQTPVHHSPPPAFTQWPTSGQEKMLMQTHTHQEKRQNEQAIGLALGGDDASLRSKGSNLNLNGNGYPVEAKGKGRDEAYEMHEVESPYANGNGNGQQQQQQYEYQMPAPPQPPVLHHPGYGRQRNDGGYEEYGYGAGQGQR